jgi:hypothetical protein
VNSLSRTLASDAATEASAAAASRTTTSPGRERSLSRIFPAIAAMACRAWSVRASAAYRRLAAIIRAQISSGTLQRGQPVLSITRLSQEHGYARQTCSKAYRMLEREGLAARFPGLGYFVA